MSENKLIAAIFEGEALEMHAKNLATKLLSAGEKVVEQNGVSEKKLYDEFISSS